MALDFKSLPPWGQVAVAAGVGAAVAVLGHTVYPNLNEISRKNASKTAQLEELEQTIKRGRLVEENLPKIEKEIENLEAKLEDLRQILPTEPETGDLLAWIKNLSDQSNLDLKKFAPGAFKPVENTYKQFPISMDIIGNYHDLGIFFDRISKYSRIININNVVINRATGAGGKTIRSSFTATTFIYQESKPGEEAAQAEEARGKKAPKGKSRKGAKS